MIRGATLHAAATSQQQRLAQTQADEQGSAAAYAGEKLTLPTSDKYVRRRLTREVVGSTVHIMLAQLVSAVHAMEPQPQSLQETPRRGGTAASSAPEQPLPIKRFELPEVCADDQEAAAGEGCGSGSTSSSTSGFTDSEEEEVAEVEAAAAPIAAVPSQTQAVPTAQADADSELAGADMQARIAQVLASAKATQGRGGAPLHVRPPSKTTERTALTVPATAAPVALRASSPGGSSSSSEWSSASSPKVQPAPISTRGKSAAAMPRIASWNRVKSPHATTAAAAQTAPSPTGSQAPRQRSSPAAQREAVEVCMWLVLRADTWWKARLSIAGTMRMLSDTGFIRLPAERLPELAGYAAALLTGEQGLWQIPPELRPDAKRAARFWRVCAGVTVEDVAEYVPDSRSVGSALDKVPGTVCGKYTVPCSNAALAAALGAAARSTFQAPACIAVGRVLAALQTMLTGGTAMRTNELVEAGRSAGLLAAAAAQRGWAMHAERADSRSLPGWQAMVCGASDAVFGSADAASAVPWASADQAARRASADPEMAAAMVGQGWTPPPVLRQALHTLVTARLAFQKSLRYSNEGGIVTGTGSGTATAAWSDPNCTFAPATNAQSQQLSEAGAVPGGGKLPLQDFLVSSPAKLEGQASVNLQALPRVELLLAYGRAKQCKRAAAAALSSAQSAQAEEEVLAEQRRHRKVASTAGTERLYALHSKRVKRKEALAEQAAEERRQAELAACTFKPRLSVPSKEAARGRARAQQSWEERHAAELARTERSGVDNVLRAATERPGRGGAHQRGWQQHLHRMAVAASMKLDEEAAEQALAAGRQPPPSQAMSLRGYAQRAAKQYAGPGARVGSSGASARVPPAHPARQQFAGATTESKSRGSDLRYAAPRPQWPSAESSLRSVGSDSEAWAAGSLTREHGSSKAELRAWSIDETASARRASGASDLMDQAQSPAHPAGPAPARPPPSQAAPPVHHTGAGAEAADAPPAAPDLGHAQAPANRRHAESSRPSPPGAWPRTAAAADARSAQMSQPAAAPQEVPAAQTKLPGRSRADSLTRGPAQPEHSQPTAHPDGAEVASMLAAGIPPSLQGGSSTAPPAQHWPSSASTHSDSMPWRPHSHQQVLPGVQEHQAEPDAAHPQQLPAPMPAPLAGTQPAAWVASESWRPAHTAATEARSELTVGQAHAQRSGLHPSPLQQQDQQQQQQQHTPARAAPGTGSPWTSPWTSVMQPSVLSPVHGPREALTRKPLVYVEVELSSGKEVRIPLWADSDCQAVAQEAAAAHGLSQAMAGRLARVLAQQQAAASASPSMAR